MIRVFTKKAFRFMNPDQNAPDNERFVDTKPLAFAELPEWAAKDKMFEWAQADGDLEVMGGEKSPGRLNAAQKNALTKQFKDRLAVAVDAYEAAAIRKEAKAAGIELPE